mmetsp:Transcript_434/g.766  ORF Transcript_434/g.766 Transcript_434/m.766 type:complete len:86 (-) Transcript_434:116-373(-)
MPSLLFIVGDSIILKLSGNTKYCSEGTVNSDQVEVSLAKQRTRKEYPISGSRFFFRIEVDFNDEDRLTHSDGSGTFGRLVIICSS